MAANFPHFMNQSGAQSETEDTPTNTTSENLPITDGPTKAKKAPKEKGERQTPAKSMSKEQVNKVIEMVKDHSYQEIADSLNLTKHQVNRVLMEVKKNLKVRAKENPELAPKIEEYIKTYLSRPEDSKPGAGGKGGKVKNALNDIVGNILANLEKK